MVIYISVQYNAGFLPDSIPLTQGYYRWVSPRHYTVDPRILTLLGNPVKYHV